MKVSQMSKKNFSNKKHISRECFEKVRYSTYNFAQKRCLDFSEKYNKNFRCYYCDTCNGYHLTSKPLSDFKKYNKKFKCYYCKICNNYHIAYNNLKCNY